MVLMSCKKDNDRPEIPNFPSGNEWTVEQILDTLANGTFQFDKEWHKNATVKGYVIADETGGNIYRTFYLRGEDGKCIAVYRKGSSDGGSEDFNVKTGDYIGYSLYGSIISEYSKLPQIQVQEYDPNKLIVIYKRGCYDKVQPIETTIEDINAGNHLCDLVKLKNVQFDDSELGKTYADGTSNTNRSLVSCDGDAIIVRTSGYANFAADTLPEGRGTLASIVSVYNTTWQLLVRNTTDVNLTGNRCGQGGEVMDIPYNQSFASSFGTYVTKSVIGDQEWHIDHSAATMSGYVSGKAYYENEDWLISSPVDLTAVEKVVVKVNYGAKYFNNINNDVTFWVSDNYEFDSLPETATWTQIPAEIENNNYQFEDIELVMPETFVGKIVNVAVKYTSTDSAAGTIEIKSILVREGEPTPQPQNIFSETFGSGQGDFTIYNVDVPAGLTYIWKFDSQYSCMKASAFSGSALQSDSWLISPEIDLDGFASAILTFEHAYKYGANPQSEMSLWISTDYEPGTAPSPESWTPVTIPNYPTGQNWNFYESGAIDLAAYLGQTVRIAFRYNSTTAGAPTWEVKNVLIKE